MGIDLRKADNGYYYVHWTEGRRSRRESTSTKELDAAKRYLSHWLNFERTPRPAVQSPTCAALWERYMRDHVRKECATAERHECAWRMLAPTFAELRPADVTRDVVAEHIAKRDAKPSSVAIELRLLLASFAHGVKNKLVASTDVPDGDTLGIPAPPPPRERWLRRDEVARLLNAAADLRGDGPLSRVERFIWIALETAARRTAILELTWDLIDFETRMIHFNPPGRVQTSKRRVSVPISSSLLPILQRAYAERQGDAVVGLSTASIWEALNKVAVRAGLKGVTPHVFRHTAATEMARRGVSLWKISKILGNTLEQVERVYAKYAPDDLRECVEHITGPEK